VNEVYGRAFATIPGRIRCVDLQQGERERVSGVRPAASRLRQRNRGATTRLRRCKVTERRVSHPQYGPVFGRPGI